MACWLKRKVNVKRSDCLAHVAFLWEPLLYIYVCICEHVYKCLYVLVYIYILYIYTWVCEYVYICLYLCVNVYKYASIYIIYVKIRGVFTYRSAQLTRIEVILTGWPMFLPCTTHMCVCLPHPLSFSLFYIYIIYYIYIYIIYVSVWNKGI